MKQCACCFINILFLIFEGTVSQSSLGQAHKHLGAPPPYYSGSQYSLYFPCPGRDVPITVELVRRKQPGDIDEKSHGKLPKKSQGRSSSSRLSLEDPISAEEHHHAHQHHENLEVEVRDLSIMSEFFNIFTRFVVYRYLENWFFSNGIIGLPSKSLVVHVSNSLRIVFSILQLITRIHSLFVLSTVSSTSSDVHHHGHLYLKNWLCHEFPSQNSLHPEIACWYYQDDKETAFLACNRATVDELDLQFAKNQHLDIDRHKFEMKIPILQLSHQHWIFEAISTSPT